MNLDKYPLKAESTLTVFEFVSTGSKGNIHKIVQFQETDESGLYNLAFGDKNEKTGEIDDMIVSNNSDTEKVLATIIEALYLFCEKYPDAFVYATGSTMARTRLYRMGITRFYKEVVRDFEIYGQSGDEFQKFEVGTEYIGFLAVRKKA